MTALTTLAVTDQLKSRSRSGGDAPIMAGWYAGVAPGASSASLAQLAAQRAGPLWFGRPRSVRRLRHRCQTGDVGAGAPLPEPRERFRRGTGRATASDAVVRPLDHQVATCRTSVRDGTRVRTQVGQPCCGDAVTTGEIDCEPRAARTLTQPGFRTKSPRFR